MSHSSASSKIFLHHFCCKIPLEEINPKYSHLEQCSLVQSISNNAVSEEYIEKSSNEIMTNNRKSYYEQDKYNNLKSWNRIWFWSYLFLWVIFSLSLFLTTNEYSQLSIISKVGLIISFIGF